MAAPSFVAVSAAVATGATATPAYPVGLAAGDLIVMFVSSSVSGIGSAPAGWTAIGSPQTGGGTTVMAWWRIATGAETGTQTVTITSGTKGAAWMTAYRPVKGGTLTATGTYGSQAAAASTVTVTGGSITTAVDDLLVELALLTAATSFTSAAFNPVLSQPSATMATTARLASRTSSNTLYFNQMSGEVTTGAAGAPSTTFTTVGSNGSGSAAYILVRETVAAAFAGTVALSGVGALTGAGTPATAGASTLTGAGSLATTGAPSASGALAFTGTGALSLAGTPGAVGTLALSSNGALTATGTPTTGGVLTLNADGTLTLAGHAQGPATNITVTATLEPSRWAATTPARTKTATLQTRRWAGTL